MQCQSHIFHSLYPEDYNGLENVKEEHGQILFWITMQNIILFDNLQYSIQSFIIITEVDTRPNIMIYDSNYINNQATYIR